MDPVLKSLLVFLGLSILTFVALRLAVCISSILLRILLWTGAAALFVLAVNYLLLPRLGMKPLPVRSGIVRPAQAEGERLIREQIPRVERHVKPIVKKAVRRYITEPLLEGTTGFAR